jgi:inosine-uridine nucleoside N-ribohydrolase
VAKRTDVAVGLGAGYKAAGTGEHQGAWVKDYNLAGYPGKVQTDGVGALIAAIDAAPQPITLISLGPSDTVAAALERKPDIAAKAFFVGMQGSLRKGYGGSDKAAAEYNVAANIAAAKKVLGAPWRKTTITPLDTCGLVNLSGRRFQTLCESDDELVKALLENYRIWKKADKVSESTILFDTVAVYLAYPEPKSLVVMEELPIAVTDKGFTAIDPAGAKMSVATAWKDLDGYRDLLVEVLLSNERQKR